MDDWSKGGTSLKIATNNFTYEEVKFLFQSQRISRDVKATPNKAGKNYILYIYKSSKKDFINIIKPYMIKSMYYKLN